MNAQDKPVAEGRLEQGEQLAAILRSCQGGNCGPVACQLRAAQGLDPDVFANWCKGLREEKLDFLVAYCRCCQALRRLQEAQD